MEVNPAVGPPLLNLRGFASNCNTGSIINPMHTLYDSETYSVTHMLANAEAEPMPRVRSKPSSIPAESR